MANLETYHRIFSEYLNSYGWDQNPKSLYEPVEYLMGIGGKRIRPVLVLMGCGLFKEDASHALNAAMAVEVFHNFTLMHDDVMDEANIRRGFATTHVKYDINSAILSGDAMLIQSYSLLNDYPQSKDLIRCFTKMGRELCEGQRLDMDFEKLDVVTIADYLKMIEGKTAILLAACLQLGAILGDADKDDQHHLYEFGKNIGIAFQIQDDVLDTFGDEVEVGKKIGGDILQKKKTYLYLKAIELSTETEKTALIALYGSVTLSDEQKIREVTKRFNSLVVEEYAHQVKDAYYDLAVSHLAQVNVDQERKQVLSDLAKQLIIRRK